MGTGEVQLLVIIVNFNQENETLKGWNLQNYLRTSYDLNLGS